MSGDTSMDGSKRGFQATLWTMALKAKDLSQGLVSELLERKLLHGDSPERGRFRTFLLTVLKRYRIKQSELRRAQKRGGGRAVLSLDFQRTKLDFTIMPTTDETPERSFSRRWALEAMSRALRALAKELEPHTFDAAKPHLAGGPAYDETAKSLGITVTRLNNLLHRTRRRYRELLRGEVAGTVGSSTETDQEVRSLGDAVQF